MSLLEVKDEPTKAEVVHNWLNKCSRTLRLPEVAKIMGITRYRLENVMAGKTELSEKENIEFIKWIANYYSLAMVDYSREAENERKKQELELVKDNDPL